MGSNIGKDQGLCSIVTEAVKEVAKIPVWCKLTPATADIVVEAAACFRGGADAIVSSNTFPFASADRSRDARVRDQRRRIGVERRTRRAGDSADVAREHGAADQGVSRTRASPASAASPTCHRRCRYFLLGCGHGAGVHRGDARSGGRPERHQAAERAVRRVPREACGRRVAVASRISADRGATRGSAVADPASRARRTIRAATSRSRDMPRPQTD